jgi:hypothetical protein
MCATASGVDHRGMSTTGNPSLPFAPPPKATSARTIHIVGAIGTLVAAALALGHSWLLTFGYSYCDEPSAEALHALRTGLLRTALAFALVPLFVGFWARWSRTHSAVWFAIAVAGTALGTAAALTAQQSQWCLF